MPLTDAQAEAGKALDLTKGIGSYLVEDQRHNPSGPS